MEEDVNFFYKLNLCDGSVPRQLAHRYSNIGLTNPSKISAPTFLDLQVKISPSISGEPFAHPIMSFEVIREYYYAFEIQHDEIIQITYSLRVALMYLANSAAAGA